MTTRLAVAMLVLALTGDALARAPKPPLCRDGRFVTPPGSAPLVAGSVAATPDALVVGGGTPTIAIAGVCPAVKVHLRPTKKGTVVTAAWPRNACGATRVRLRATIDATCRAMQGVLRVPRSAPVHFVAPRCGDGLPCDVRRELRFSEGAHVDDEDVVAARLDLFRDEGVFEAFGIHGAQDCDRSHK